MIQSTRTQPDPPKQVVVVVSVEAKRIALYL
jgi:hypothetical protein